MPNWCDNQVTITGPNSVIDKIVKIVRQDENIDLSAYKKSDEIETMILSIDPSKQRISLGIKQLDSDPFQEYLTMNPKNTTVKGTIAEVDERNALISLADKVNGLLNISEVSRDKVEDMRSSFRPNDEIEAKIVGYDKKNRTIKLSIKAKEETEEKEALETYKKDEKENISKTSLGDLLKSKFIKSINKYLPDITEHMLSPDYAGIRPITSKEDRLKRDFTISTSCLLYTSPSPRDS